MNLDALIAEANRRALGIANTGMVTLTPAPTNVVDLKSGKPWYPPGSLARSLAGNEKHSDADFH
jgi:hypothetical protein